MLVCKIPVCFMFHDILSYHLAVWEGRKAGHSGSVRFQQWRLVWPVPACELVA